MMIWVCWVCVCWIILTLPLVSIDCSRMVSTLPLILSKVSTARAINQNPTGSPTVVPKIMTPRATTVRATLLTSLAHPVSPFIDLALYDSRDVLKRPLAKVERHHQPGPHADVAL